MKLLISKKSLSNFKSKDLIPLECYECLKTFHCTKNNIQKVLKGSKNLALKFCSRVCMGKNKITKKEITCLYCKKTKLVVNHDFKKSKFCSKICANKSRTIPNKPTKPKRIIKPKKFCKCSKPLNSNNKTGFCRDCYHLTKQAMEQRGRTFSKTRKYKTNPFTKEEFYLMSSLEELFFDLAVKNKINFTVPTPIKYKDIKGKLHTYFPDFYIPALDIIVEIKGFLTKEDKIKMNLVKTQNPTKKIDIVFKNQIEEYINILVNLIKGV